MDLILSSLGWESVISSAQSFYEGPKIMYSKCLVWMRPPTGIFFTKWAVPAHPWLNFQNQKDPLGSPQAYLMPLPAQTRDFHG